MFFYRINNGSYLSPVLDLGFGDVLDGDLEAVAVAHAGVDDAEAALAEDVADFVGPLEGLARRGGHAERKVWKEGGARNTLDLRTVPVKG